MPPLTLTYRTDTLRRLNGGWRREGCGYGFHFGLIEADADEKGGATRLPSVSWRVPVCGLRRGCRCRIYRHPLGDEGDACLSKNDSHFNVLKHIPWPKLTVIAIKDLVLQLDSNK